MTHKGKKSEKNVLDLLSDIQREFGAVTLEELVKDPHMLSVLTSTKSSLHAVIWYTQSNILLPNKARPIDLAAIDAEAVLFAANNYVNGAFIL